MTSTQKPVSFTVTTPKNSCFKPAQDQKQIQDLSCKKFANSSEKKIHWVVGLFQQWCEYRINSMDCDDPIRRCDLQKLDNLNKLDLAYSLSRFITEICKLNRDEYPPRTVYQMCICLQMFLETNRLHWKILNKQDPLFMDFYYVLDNVMKQKSAQGLGKVQSTDVISKEVENHVWHMGILGEDHPKQLGEQQFFFFWVYT